MRELLRRQFLRHAPRVWRRIPSQYRQRVLEWGFRHFAPLFEGHPHFERWQRDDHAQVVARARANNLVDIESRAPLPTAPGSIALHLHVFYPDVATELARYVAHMPFPYDLFVSVANAAGEAACRRAFSGLAHCRALTISVVDPRGRDIAPLFCAFGARLRGYDFVAHMHGKKSLYNHGDTEGWRQYACESLLGSDERIRRISAWLVGDEARGVVYPQNYFLLHYTANTWLGTRALGEAWCARLGIAMPHGYFDYPAGSMFWARGDALRPLFDAGITIDDFPAESGQTDGTLAHGLERLIVLASSRRAAILRDDAHPAWSSWRFDQYLRRTREGVIYLFTAPATKVIGFDVYDTLLTRTLLDAEHTKRIVARRAGDDGALYLAHRAAAEDDARMASDRDVGLDAIYTHLARRTQLPAATLTRLRALEEAVERQSVSPRADVVALYHEARKSGHPVALITDTALPRALIEASLREHGIDGWDALFVSSEVGVRKDSGALYERVCTHYGIAMTGLVMIGDNERSDFQVPQDRGAVVQHVLRPIELARGWPRFSTLIDQYERHRDFDAQLTLAIVVRGCFAQFVPPFADPSSLLGATPFALGYGVVGPLLVAFSDWLARQHGSTQLCFLAREGQLMQRVYEAWSGERSRYLVVSRRTTGVAAIESLDDILAIAAADFWPAPLQIFLRDRFGIEAEVEKREVEVRDGNIDALRPVLTQLAPQILAQAAREREALLRYLGELDEHVAVVDVGYSGTIQRDLCRLLGKSIAGYYLMTNTRAPQNARGCFAESIAEHDTPRIYTERFELERLLSSNDPQVIRYELDGTARVRPLSTLERGAVPTRAQLQDGVMRFVADARQQRELVPGFTPSIEVARALLEQLVAAPSDSERTVLRAIALDDHHHGRGVVG